GITPGVTCGLRRARALRAPPFVTMVRSRRKACDRPDRQVDAVVMPCHGLEKCQHWIDRMPMSWNGDVTMSPIALNGVSKYQAGCGLGASRNGESNSSCGSCPGEVRTTITQPSAGTPPS